jgi:phage terminase large subunit-like protein
LTIDINKKFEPLWLSPTRYFILTGGRGSSKSFTVSTFANLLTFGRNHSILFTRFTLTSAEISIIPEFVEKIELMGYESAFQVKQTEIINKKTKSDIIFRGIKTSQGTQTANLKSLTGLTTWICDEAEEVPDEQTFDDIDLSIRSKLQDNRVILILNPTHKEHWIYKRFFEPNQIEDGFNGVVGNVTYIHTTYLDNEKNLSKSFVDYCDELKLKNPNKYYHRILGGWLADVDGALWSYALMQRIRCDNPPDMKRIVIAIDPAVTATSESDETGIIVCGIDGNERGYLLEDISGRYTPGEWARHAIYAYNKWDADAIVGEVNQGGDLIKNNIKLIDNSIKFVEVRASKGKYTRAEPIAALYDEGRIFHVGHFSKLENQMTTWVPGDNSPDRIDAMVWGFTFLFLKKKGGGFA